MPGLRMRLGDRTWKPPPPPEGLGWSLVMKELSLGSAPCRTNSPPLGPQLLLWRKRQIPRNQSDVRKDSGRSPVGLLHPSGE